MDGQEDVARWYRDQHPALPDDFVSSLRAQLTAKAAGRPMPVHDPPARCRPVPLPTSLSGGILFLGIAAVLLLALGLATLSGTFNRPTVPSDRTTAALTRSGFTLTEPAGSARITSTVAARAVTPLIPGTVNATTLQTVRNSRVPRLASKGLLCWAVIITPAATYSLIPADSAFVVTPPYGLGYRPRKFVAFVDAHSGAFVVSSPIA